MASAHTREGASISCTAGLGECGRGKKAGRAGGWLQDVGGEHTRHRSRSMDQQDMPTPVQQSHATVARVHPNSNLNVKLWGGPSPFSSCKKGACGRTRHDQPFSVVSCLYFLRFGVC
jgi:hypothetical protein